MEYIYSKGEGEFKEELFVLFHGTGGTENSLLFLTGELNPYSGVLSFLGNVGKGESRRFFNPLVDNKLDKEDLSRRVDSFLEIWDKMEIARDKSGSRMYQSVNRRTMAIKMTANQPKVSSKKCRLRMDSFLVCPLRMTRLANTLILTAIIPSQRIPSSLTGCGLKSLVIFSKITRTDPVMRITAVTMAPKRLKRL